MNQDTKHYSPKYLVSRRLENSRMAFTFVHESGLSLNLTSVSKAVFCVSPVE
jgi:hypothetical protein